MQALKIITKCGKYMYCIERFVATHGHVSYDSKSNLNYVFEMQICIVVYGSTKDNLHHVPTSHRYSVPVAMHRCFSLGEIEIEM